MFGKSDMLEHELDMLKIDVDSSKNKLDMVADHFWATTNADWFIYLQSKYNRILGGIKDKCMVIIAKEEPKVSLYDTFKGGPTTFTYKKLQLYVTMCGLNNDIANYYAIYDGGDLPASISRELFEFATAMYKEKGSKK